MNKKLGAWFYISSIIVIIIVVSLFIHYSYKSSTSLVPLSIESDSLFLKLAIIENGNITNNVKIKNTYSSTQDFSVKVNGLDDVINVDSSKFRLDANEEHNIILSFDAKGKGKGVFLGTLDVSSNGNLKEIPIILEIQSKDVFFDTNIYLYPQGANIISGQKLDLELKLYDLANVGRANVKAFYYVKDFRGKTFVSDSETLLVDGKLEYTKSLALPKNVPIGSYVLITVIEYKESVGTSTIYFDVTDNKEQTPGSGTNIVLLFILLGGFFLITILLLVFYFLFFKDRLLRELEVQYKREIKKQVELIRLREKKDYSKLRSSIERKIYSEAINKVKKQRIEALSGIYKDRVVKYKEARKKLSKLQLKRQLSKWKKEGYDTKILERKYKIPTVVNIRKKVKEWKKQGYNMSMLDNKKLNNEKPKISDMKKKIKKWKKRGYDTRVLGK